MSEGSGLSLDARNVHTLDVGGQRPAWQENSDTCVYWAFCGGNVAIVIAAVLLVTLRLRLETVNAWQQVGALVARTDTGGDLAVIGGLTLGMVSRNG